uniref:Tyrosyl-DNA phosphodiesterase 1 n=1 Tax=Sinocyclocheilus rhinocerous TaxID=307959 RepID=A0A673MCX6_9TELE
MSQDSQHGKWTITDSEDEDNIIPPTPQKDSNKPSIKPDLERKPDKLTTFFMLEPKLSPKSNEDTHSVNQPSAPPMGSEARTRKRETEEAGWNLSSSEDETPTSASKNEPKKSTVSPKRKKTEDKRPPSPHGTSYYKEEPADFFEANLLSMNDMYRFYLKSLGYQKSSTVEQILSPMFGTLKESVQVLDKPVILVHGEKRESKVRLIEQAKPYPHIPFCQAKLDIAFGTHHTKMMLLWYEEGLRVIILTSNLIRADWYQKTQGMWMSPLYPRLPEGSPGTAGESPTNFKRDLLEYLEAYQAPELAEWIDHIKRHDLSETRVYLIGSTPGKYQGPAMEKWGHLRLRKVIEHTKPMPNEEQWHVLGQFSSIGSMGLDKTKWLAAEFQRTLTTLGKAGKSLASPETQMFLVYPSVENVRTSLEGYPAQKQLWLHSYFHGWNADVTGRSNAMPHIKTYMRVSPDFTQLAWFLVTSANLSKAAWGALEKNNTQIMVRSYELGVLYLPSAFNMSTFPVEKNVFPASSSSKGFPVPFDLPPQRYSSKDQPWIWNIPYAQAPDTHGNVWVPS